MKRDVNLNKGAYYRGAYRVRQVVKLVAPLKKIFVQFKSTTFIFSVSLILDDLFETLCI